MPFVNAIGPVSMNNRKSRRGSIALLTMFVLFGAMLWWGRSVSRQGPFEVTFMRVSGGQPVELYYRDHNRLVPGGRSLSWLQGQLQRVGLKVDFVSGRTLFGGVTNRVCVVMGVNGPPLSSSASATITVGSDQIPLEFRSRWTKPGADDRQLVMWQSAPDIKAPKRGTLIVKDPNSEELLIQRRF
jgi:hypothetical protein